MPQELRSIQKVGLNAHQALGTASTAIAPDGVSFGVAPMVDSVVLATLELSVSKSGGPVATFVEVGSTGTDDEVFNDHQLDPGPVRKPLLEGNTYAVLWRGAFVATGTATLHILVTQADGTVLVQNDMPLPHPPNGSPFSIVVM